MGAVWMLARHELRGRWRSTIALAVLVGLVGAVVLASVAGARRPRHAARDLHRARARLDPRRQPPCRAAGVERSSYPSCNRLTIGVTVATRLEPVEPLELASIRDDIRAPRVWSASATVALCIAVLALAVAVSASALDRARRPRARSRARAGRGRRLVPRCDVRRAAPPARAACDRDGDRRPRRRPRTARRGARLARHRHRRCARRGRSAPLVRRGTAPRARPPSHARAAGRRARDTRATGRGLARLRRRVRLPAR